MEDEESSSGEFESISQQHSHNSNDNSDKLSRKRRGSISKPSAQSSVDHGIHSRRGPMGGRRRSVVDSSIRSKVE